MTIRISTASRTAAALAILAVWDANASPAYIEIRSGTQPANPNTAASGIVLATFALADPSFTEAGGVLTMASMPRTDVSADGTGTATWFRLYDGGASAQLDGSVTLTGGGGDMEINNTSIATGQTVSIVATSTITVPV